MTEVYLDNGRVEFEETGKGSTVEELVEAVCSELKALERLVVGLELDGSALEDIRQSPALKDPISGYREIRLTTASAFELAGSAAGLVVDYVKFIDEGIKGYVDALRRGEGVQEKVLVSVLEGVGEVTGTLGLLSESPAAGTIGFFEENPEECYRRLLACVEAVDSARRANDAITVADVLEYELAPLIREVSRKLVPPGGD